MRIQLSRHKLSNITRPLHFSTNNPEASGNVKEEAGEVDQVIRGKATPTNDILKREVINVCRSSHEFDAVPRYGDDIDLIFYGHDI